MTVLNFRHLREVNLRRQGPDGWNHALHGWSFDDWFIAVGGEIGEALNVVKKLNRARDGLAGNSRTLDELKADLADELADAVLYLDLMLASIDKTFEDMLGDRNFAELRNITVDQPDERPPSAIGRSILKDLARVTPTGARAGLVLQRLDDLAEAYRIDLGAAVVSKFNRTSEKLGFPHRLVVT